MIKQQKLLIFSFMLMCSTMKKRTMVSGACFYLHLRKISCWNLCINTQLWQIKQSLCEKCGDWEVSWCVCHLPRWLQDNNILHFNNILTFCVAIIDVYSNSVFRVHTETRNIWTYLLDVTRFFLSRPIVEIEAEGKTLLFVHFE